MSLLMLMPAGDVGLHSASDSLFLSSHFLCSFFHVPVLSCCPLVVCGNFPAFRVVVFLQLLAAFLFSVGAACFFFSFMIRLVLCFMVPCGISVFVVSLSSDGHMKEPTLHSGPISFHFREGMRVSCVPVVSDVTPLVVSSTCKSGKITTERVGRDAFPEICAGCPKVGVWVSVCGGLRF